MGAGGEELILAAGKVYFGADAESFPGVAGHGLLDRAVVLDPLEPRGLPDTGEVHGSGVGDEVRRIVVEVDRKNDVADAIQRIETRVAFFDSLRLDGFLHHLDFFYLCQD